ncbi:MAG: hypothetical protein IV100_24075 [Myxococcales bacterium]|nr:hypothetical protein [Myxococcales bacterium]
MTAGDSDARPDRSTAMGKRVVVVTIGSVVVFATLVLSLTGVITGNKGAVRRAAPIGSMEGGLTWYRFEVALPGASPGAAFLMAVEAVPGGGNKAVIVNGREELPVTWTGRTDSGCGDDRKAACEFGFDVPAFGTRAAFEQRPQGLFGTLQIQTKSVSTLPIAGFRLSEGLPEMRYPQAPAGATETRAGAEPPDFNRRWALRLGDAATPAVLDIAVSSTDSAVGALVTAKGDLGQLAGRQFGDTLLLSNFDGVRAVALRLKAGASDVATGTLAVSGEPAVAVDATRDDDAVEPAAPPIPDATPAGRRPEILVWLRPWERASAEAVALVKRLGDRHDGLDVTFVAVEGDVEAVKRFAAATGVAVRRAPRADIPVTPVVHLLGTNTPERIGPIASSAVLRAVQGKRLEEWVARAVPVGH